MLHVGDPDAARPRNELVQCPHTWPQTRGPAVSCSLLVLKEAIAQAHTPTNAVPRDMLSSRNAFCRRLPQCRTGRSACVLSGWASLWSSSFSEPRRWAPAGAQDERSRTQGPGPRADTNRCSWLRRTSPCSRCRRRTPRRRGRTGPSYSCTHRPGIGASLQVTPGVRTVLRVRGSESTQPHRRPSPSTPPPAGEN